MDIIAPWTSAPPYPPKTSPELDIYPHLAMPSLVRIPLDLQDLGVRQLTPVGDSDLWRGLYLASRGRDGVSLAVEQAGKSGFEELEARLARGLLRVEGLVVLRAPSISRRAHEGLQRFFRQVAGRYPSGGPGCAVTDGERVLPRAGSPSTTCPRKMLQKRGPPRSRPWSPWSRHTGSPRAISTAHTPWPSSCRRYWSPTRARGPIAHPSASDARWLATHSCWRGNGET